MNRPLPNSSKTDRPDDILERALLSVQAEPIPAGPPDPLLGTTLRALQDAEAPITRPLPLVPRTRFMKLLTTAAGVALSLGLATLLTVALRPSSSAFAQTTFGQAIQQVSQARTLSYIQSLTIEGKAEPVQTRCYIAADGRKRTEMPPATQPLVVTIFDQAGYIRLSLLEPTKTALVREPLNGAVNAGHMFADWIERLKQLGDKPDKQLGQKE